MKFLIQWAYQVQDFQISKATGWMNSDRYDIEAKAVGGLNLNNKQSGAMFQALLADRFKLVLHRESKPQDTYVLTTARGGAKMHPSDEATCASPQCGGIRVSPGGVAKATHSPMSTLAVNLSFLLGRPVIDNTGLTGTFDFKLEWTPDQAIARRPGEAPVQPPSDSNLPSLFTALQEQLGLKLEPQKGMVEILVIDHAEKDIGN